MMNHLGKSNRQFACPKCGEPMAPVEVDRTNGSELEFLRNRVEELEALLCEKSDALACLGLSPREQAIFGHIMAREFVTYSSLLVVACGNLHEDDQPEINTMKVHVCRVRQKLAPHGIEIKTVWGRGFYMTEEMKAKTRRFIDEESATMHPVPQFAA